MSSGRSARLPATPTQTANNKHRAAAAAAAAAAAGVAAGEPNSNSMLQYGSSSSTVPTTAATGTAASGLGMGVGVVGGGMGGGMGMSMGMGVVGGMGMGMGGGMAPYSLHGSTMGSSCESSVERIPVDTIDALGPELAVATSQVLENLSENERKMIIEVLNRDESVRQRDATRMMELQSASGEWLKDAYALGSCSAVDHLTTSDVLRKSIRRSWTISNPEDDPNNPNSQQPVADNLYPQQQHLIEAQSAGSYPTLHQHHQQHHLPPQPRPTHGIGYGSGTATPTTSSKWQLGRRVLRQSTLPTSLNNDPTLSGSGGNLANYNSVNLTAPTSPHQLQKSPLYPSAYNSDDVIHMNTMPGMGMGVGVTVDDCDNYAQQQQQPQLEVTPTHHRLQVRRQSTLPAQPTPAIYMSTSPNRLYSRSPERSPGEHQRYPPFMRQTSFPEPPSTYHRTKLLPSTGAPPSTIAPPPLNYESQASSLASGDQDVGPMPKPRMTRQATLPNPEQHVKLLPTSPPKRQTSPQFRRSPEFMRQQTLPNPEAFSSGNTLTVHSTPPAKFMPISPRAKQNFLFPSVPNPRQFLSQPHVPAVGGTDLGSGGSVASTSAGGGEQYSSSQSVNIHHSRDPHAKMIKVRSHSNEEYSNTKGHPENRRLLPEIPTAVQRTGGRSPSRLVRQDCLKEERTFGEAKQQFHQFPDVTEELDNRPEYVDYFGDSATSFLESDEVQYERNYNAGFSSEPRIIYNNGSDDGSYQNSSQRPIYSAENVLADSGYGGGAGVGLGVSVGSGGVPSYYPDMGTPQGFYGGAALPRTPLMHNRMRRRQSRELQMQQEELAQLSQVSDVSGGKGSGNEGSSSAGGGSDGNATERRKPEQMRSVSEDSGAKTTPKPVTRRSFSHPEKDTQPTKKTEITKIPSPRPLADILDKTRGNSKIPQARRRNSRTGIGEAEEASASQEENPNPPGEPGQGSGAEQPVNGKSLESAANKDGGDPNSASEATHTSTLGEQELQNAVEAAAVVFKKVVLQRRKEKEKAAEEEEAKVAAEELTRSPVIGQRQADGTGSPIQSRASSETWPTQSDEDIDRLVAMHQNRSSLSSLGVRSESMASVYSGAGEGRYGTVVVKGQVEFAMQYNYKLSALEIHVVRCKDLAAVDAKRNRSDPYVKVYLLPDKSKAGKRKTKVKKHTLNPIFDETMRFHTPISSLESRTLWLTVWHSDMFGRNDFLGEVSVNLQGRLFDNPQSQWYLLQERSEPFDEVATYRGDIVVGLKYIPPESIKSSFFSRGSSLTGSSSNLRKFGGSIKSVASKSDRTSKGGQLHVLVKEAKHLSPIKANGTCDAFCKSYLLPDRTRSSKQKTPVVKRTLHPSWNYTFVYEDVSLEELSERALELTVWDHDRLASNEFVGGIRFSLGTGRSYGRQVEWMDATGKELSLWQNMLDRPNFWVEGSLVLRSTLDGIRANLP